MGAWIAVACALCWSIAIIFFKKIGDAVHPYTLNLFKNVVAFTMMFATLLIFDEAPFSSDGLTWQAWLLLICSGVMGIGIADGMALKSLQMVGAARFAIIECAYAPAMILAAVLFLGERLSPLQSAGIVMVMSAVLAVSLEKGPSEEVASGQGPTDRPLLLGGAIGVTAILLMVVGILMVKPLFAQVSLLKIVCIRLAAGSFASYLVYRSMKFEGQPIRALLSKSDPFLLWTGVIIGSYVSMLLWVAGYKYQHASLAAILNQTSTVFTIVLAYAFLQERITPRKVLAFALAGIGIAFVLL